MENVDLKNDMVLCCVRASSFPNGVQEAHARLHALTGNMPGRKYYGVSYPNGSGQIEYKAGVQLDKPNEASFECETFVLRKGQYVGETVTNFVQKPGKIGQVFEKLLKNSRLDPHGYCLEEYLNEKDVRCLVKVL